MKTLAIYPGSFDPFHRGHLDVLNKTLKMFDKVVIAIGKNPDKVKYHPQTGKTLSKAVAVRKELAKIHYDIEIVEFNDLLTDEVRRWTTKGYNVVVVKGIRNAVDLEYEMAQLRILQDIDTIIDFVFVPADVKYQHISSSTIRSLEKIKKGLGKKYLIKTGENESNK